MVTHRYPARYAENGRAPSLEPSVSPSTPSPRRHVLDLDDFSRDEIEHVLTTADAMKEVLAREIKRVPTLRDTTVATLFYEASTRTRVSFELAAKSLSADVVNLTASTSSVTKGESLIDTSRTLQALGANVIVMRHPQAGAPYVVAQNVNVSVMNAGDGWHAHPTQALLDLYTMRAKLGAVEGAKVVIIGDILHSRVARSNIWGLRAMGAQVVLCGPPTLLPYGLNGLSKSPEANRAALPLAEVELDLDKAVRGADVVMVLRLQKERQEHALLPSLREYVSLYQLNRERLAKAKPKALVMHPGPMNEGLEIAPEVAHGGQSVVEEQVTNGVAIRMALLYLLARSGKA